VLPEGSRSCHKLFPILKSSSSYVSRDPVHVRSFLRRTLQQNHEKSNSSSNVHTIYIHALVPLVLRCVLYISIKSQRVQAATRKAPNSQALSPLKFVFHDLVLLRIFWRGYAESLIHCLISLSRISRCRLTLRPTESKSPYRKLSEHETHTLLLLVESPQHDLLVGYDICEAAEGFHEWFYLYTDLIHYMWSLRKNKLTSAYIDGGLLDEIWR